MTGKRGRFVLANREPRREKNAMVAEPRRVPWPPDAYENSWAPEVKGSWYPYSENGVVNIKRAPLRVGHQHHRACMIPGEVSSCESSYKSYRGAHISQRRRWRHCSLACDDRRSSHPLSFRAVPFAKGCDSGYNSRRRDRRPPITPRSPDDTTPLGHLSFLTVRVPAVDDNYLALLNREPPPPSARNIVRSYSFVSSCYFAPHTCVLICNNRVAISFTSVKYTFRRSVTQSSTIAADSSTIRYGNVPSSQIPLSWILISARFPRGSAQSVRHQRAPRKELILTHVGQR